MTKAYPRPAPEQFDNFPPTLRKLRQWICWVLKTLPSGKKPAKLLIDVKSPPARRGGDASHSDANTWASYEEALAYFNTNKTIKYQGETVPVCGLGFVFSPLDPYTGIDIDDCRDPDSGALLPEAEMIVNTLDSYTEFSPSGTGVHIIVEATLPYESGRRRNRVEVYSHSRYFTATGDKFAGVPFLAEKRQKELNDICELIFGPKEYKPKPPEAAKDNAKLARVRAIADDTLLTKMRNAANGTKFIDLWEANGVADHSQADAALCSILAYWTRCDNVRIDRLFRQSALFRKKWDEQRGRETYGNNTIAFAVRGAIALYDPDLDATVRETHNDIANTEILVQLHGDEFLYAKEWREWLVWNCHRWKPQADLDLLRASEDVSKELLRRATEHQDPDAKKQEKIIKWAISSGDDRRVNSIEKYARRRLYRNSSDFDRDPYLLCCSNGIVDLRTGQLRDGTRGDMMTRTTDIEFIKGGSCPNWDGFLSDIMEGDDEMIAYLWRVIGYSLTGDITERAFFLFHGEGRNGKSTFVETLKALLGPPGYGYAQKARFSTFLRKQFAGGANDDVAHLAGARVVVASEADEKTALDVALVKELTGGDTHRARFLYGREFEFNPQFKLFLVTNKIPPIQETTYAIWDRLHYVPFKWRVTNVDRMLPLKLLGELPGILSKAVEACIDWQREGLCPPEKVLEAGKVLHKEMDILAQFIDECCEKNEGLKIMHKTLYKAFNYWSRAGGIQKPLSSKWLAGEMRSQNFTEERLGGNVMHWRGIKVTDAFMDELVKKAEESAKKAEKPEDVAKKPVVENKGLNFD